jgi:hypothetical protein
VSRAPPRPGAQRQVFVVEPGLATDRVPGGPSHPHSAPGRALCGQDGGALRSSPVPARTRIPNTGILRPRARGPKGPSRTVRPV